MSKSDAWMPLYIGDYLADTMALNAQEHGAYLLLIMHYWRNGPLPDDDRALAAIARVERKAWVADIGPIVRGFFTVDGGKLHQRRIDKERADAARNSEKRRAAANARWGSSKEQAECKTDANASALHDECRSPSPSPCSSLRSEHPSLRSVGAIAPKPKSDRGSKLPADWEPGPELRDFAKVEGVDCDRELAKFRDYWGALTGSKATKTDWQATFRNWVRNARDRQFSAVSPSRQSADERRSEARDGWLEGERLEGF